MIFVLLKKKKISEDPCTLCGKFYVSEDKARLWCGDDECQRYHILCKYCWRDNVSFCPAKKRKKKLDKYYRQTFVSLIKVICEDLCKKYCTGCFFFYAPALTHSCLLHEDDKIKKYARIAIQIINKSGVVCNELRMKLEEKKNKIVFSDSEITEIFESRMTYELLKDDIEILFE